ncbi:hypothetical protein [Natronobeatus ordinarius]|uniref:hypothetical protein n=1 Tax=Natronobeatus ordinarius TaxID=2963433 RepID=UPI0020CFA69A|nr:hypothetical protein [Natronobeatus ordinarius]
MERDSVAIGPLTVSFSDDPFCRNILDTMYGELPRSSSKPDIRITGHDWRTTELPQNETIQASQKISVCGDVHYVNEVRSYGLPKSLVVDRIGQRGYAFEIEGWETDSLNIDVYYDGKLYNSGLYPLRYLLKLKNRFFAEYQTGLAKHFVRSVFEPLWLAWMSKKGFAFLHAASVSVNGRGVALTGWGGTGKTSTTIRWIQQSDDISFLSDDLAIISGQGKIYPYYRSIVIYSYNTDNSILSKSVFLDGVADQLQWNWRERRYDGMGVGRRVPPEELFDDQLGLGGPPELDVAVYLSREERERFTHEYLSAEELAQRSTAVILFELDWLLEYSATVCSAGSIAICPQDIVNDIGNTYRKCFRDVKTILLRTPTSAGPEELTDYLEAEILE